MSTHNAANDRYGARDDSCKGCSASIRIEDEQLSRILQALSSNPEQCVDDDLYEKRLAICRACPSLAYETTCLHCGCLIAVRAKLNNKACPYPGQAKW